MDAWSREIVDLHRFFERWLQGKCPATDATFERVEHALDDGFQLVHPAGRLLDRDDILTRLRKNHGAQPDLRIRIKHPRLHFANDSILVATYEEWQERADDRDGRLSTSVFRRDPTASNELVWVHVHETWIEPPDRGQT